MTYFPTEWEFLQNIWNAFFSPQFPDAILGHAKSTGSKGTKRLVMPYAISETVVLELVFSLEPGKGAKTYIIVINVDRDEYQPIANLKDFQRLFYQVEMLCQDYHVCAGIETSLNQDLPDGEDYWQVYDFKWAGYKASKEANEVDELMSAILGGNTGRGSSLKLNDFYQINFEYRNGVLDPYSGQLILKLRTRNIAASDLEGPRREARRIYRRYRRVFPEEEQS